MFLTFKSIVTDGIWIGTLNRIWERVEIKTLYDTAMVLQMKNWQCLSTYQLVYSILKDEPQIRWKNSLKEALCLELVKTAGEDR